MFYPHVKSEAEASPDLSPLHHHFHFKFPPSHDHQSRTPSDPPTPLYRFGAYPNTTSSPSSHTLTYMSYSDDYDDLPIHAYPQSSTDRAVRRRSSKACDQCRKSKCKCERSGPNELCKSCIMLGTPCTFLGPSRKRGPPKGYIDAIEARLHQTEALVGIMLASKDPRAQSLLRDIARDPLAKEIIIRVDASPYGVKGRKRVVESSSPTASKKTAEGDNPKEADDGKLDLASTHPSNEWQDKVVDMLGAGRTAEPAYIQAMPITTLNGKPALRVATYTSDDHSASDGRERRRRRLGEEDYDYEDIAAGPPSPTSTTASFPNSVGSKPQDEEKDELEEEKQLAQAVGELSLNEDEEVRYHGKASGLYLLGEQERIDKRNEGGIWRFPGARVWPPLPPTAESKDGGDSENRHATSMVTSPWQSTSISDRAGSASPGLHRLGNGLNGEELLPPRHEQERLLELYFTYVHPSFPVVHKKAFWEVWRNGGDAHPYMKRTRRAAPLLLLTMFALAARYDMPPPAAPNSPSPPSPDSVGGSPTSTTPLPTDGVSMWTAGEQYFNSAKRVLDTSYASSRPSTCQALLLMGYREVGIGAMAPAWTYVGMAIRMAQDLGMHRKAEGWRRPGLGSTNSASTPSSSVPRTKPSNEDEIASSVSEEADRIFGDWELGERRRIWFGCVVMDKYVSAYIGRPLMISERDFDTEVPELSESEELEEWKSLGVDEQWTTPVPGRVVSCFNKCAELSGVLSTIIQAIYAVRPFFPAGPPDALTSPISRPAGRQVETAKQVTALEGILDKWYLDLPEHLRYDTAVTVERDASFSLPPAHILTLHMQYWCAVLLLHRPFIRKALNSKTKTSPGPDDQLSDSDDLEVIKSRRSYELCASAANHITSIVSAYRERYPLNRCSVFLCYYVFTASIMHVISLKAYPDDPQAHINLRRCLDALSAMRYVWPSAGRALDLLSGAKMNLMAGPGASAYAVSPLNSSNNHSPRSMSSNKRKSTLALDSESIQPGASSSPVSLVNGVSAGGVEGDYVAPLRPAAGLNMHVQHGAQLQHRQREPTLQAGQHRSMRQQAYHSAPNESYAIQPPTLLAQTDYSWPVSGSSGVLGAAGESGARVAVHLPEEDQEFVPISTSVLPQLYSTGLADEHTHHRHPQQAAHLLTTSSHHGQVHPQHPQSQYSRSADMTSHAYGHTTHPQYWSDYSTFSQLGSTEAGGYASLDVGVGGVGAMELVLQDGQPPQPQPPHLLSHSQHATVSNVSGMYIPDSYELYGYR